MLQLAFELTTQQLGLVSLGILTAGSFAYAFVLKRKGERAARIVQAAFAGIKVAAGDAAAHKPTIDMIEDGIYAAAKDLMVPEEHIDQHVGEGLSAGTPPSA